MNFIRTLFIFFLTVFLCLSSGCKKKKNDDTSGSNDQNTAPATGTFLMHLHTYIDNTEVDLYNTVYSTDAGRKFSLSLAQMYISGIQLIKLDGTTVDFTGKNILKVLEQDVYIIGTAPIGNYKSFRFRVGFDPATNALSPTTPSDSAILNKPAMWFGSSAQPDGYVFMNVQGKVDTTAGATGTTAQMQPFTIKIGTNANARTITMPDKNYTILKDQVQYGHVVIDYSKVFNGLQLNQSSNLSVTTAASNSVAPATTIVNNLSSMFIYEQ